MTIRIPSRALVVLAGPSGSGKSTWAARWFRANQIVSSDDLRAMVGEHERYEWASADAFDLLDDLVERRLERGLLTVIDSLGMEADRRDAWRQLAARHRRPVHVVLFDGDAKECRRRNRARPRPVPSKVLTSQLDRWPTEANAIRAEAWTATHEDVVGQEVAVLPDALVAEATDANSVPGAALRFGLQVSAFEWGGSDGIAERLGDLAVEAEEAGFSSLWVMDHMIQIPQVGSDWEAMLESYTTLGYLAARTSTVRLGTLVTGITYRNIAHLAKIVATLDVLSGGRAVCGLGAAWFEREHAAYGWPFPSVKERFELLEDALQALPVLWGPGSPPFEGRHLSLPETTCYPRPLQDSIPILVGGSGERRTLRLVAQYADACNLFGHPDTIAHKLDVLDRHCADVKRDRDEITVTQLSPVLCAPDRRALATRVEELRPERVSPEDFARRATAGTVDDHITRFGRFADVGVQEVIVSLADVGHVGAVRDFAPVIDAFR